MADVCATGPAGVAGAPLFFYTRPALKRARGIEDANQRLRNHRGSNNLEQSLVDRFWRIYQAHAQEHRSAAAFSWHLEYPFLNYSFSDEDEAAATFARAFDAHVQLQAGKRAPARLAFTFLCGLWPHACVGSPRRVRDRDRARRMRFWGCFFLFVLLIFW